MVYRVLFTVVVWPAGFLFATWNGQVFTQALITIACCVAGSLPWLPLLPRRQDLRQRGVAITVVGITVVAIVSLALSLPGSYEFQRRFNGHAATPNHALQTEAHLPRSARSVARR